MRKLAFVAIVGAFSLAPTLASAVVYDEAVDGDLSGNRLAPTSLVLGTGINSISGTTIAGDLDYVTFSVPAALTAITLASFVSADDLGFMAIQAGTTFTEPAVPDVANLLGYSHFGTGLSFPVTTNVGENALAKMSAASPLPSGAIGFTLPLAAGDYTLWIQQTDTESVAYKFDIAAVPEPSSLALAGVGLLGLLIAARRRT